MGKNKGKDKDEIPNPMNVSNRDILQRLNFLYQASILLNSLAPPSTHRDPGSDGTSNEPSRSRTTSGTQHPSTEKAVAGAVVTGHDERSQGRKKRRVVSCGELSRSYIETMKSVGQKTNVKMDPSVKRRICKRCSAPLVPGISATVRIRDSSSHGHLISYQCHGCQTERRIPAPPILHAAPPNEDATESQPAETPTNSGPQKRKKKGPQPRLPPHFARDIGHVVFCGNEQLNPAHRVS